MSITNSVLCTGALQEIPMTRDVLRRLEDEAARLANELPRLQAQAHENGVSGDPESPTVLAAGDLHLATRRLEMLRRVITHAHVVEPDGRIVIGSRVTVRHADGESETYELVAPGEADTRSGRITPDSPLGAALLWRREHDLTHMEAPAGRVELTIISVNAPGAAPELPIPIDRTQQWTDMIHEQSVQSFPASDAPSWTGASI
jgi:transcription elongation GreA/GreB family factor